MLVHDVTNISYYTKHRNNPKQEMEKLMNISIFFFLKSKKKKKKKKRKGKNLKESCDLYLQQYFQLKDRCKNKNRCINNNHDLV